MSVCPSHINQESHFGKKRITVCLFSHLGKKCERGVALLHVSNEVSLMFGGLNDNSIRSALICFMSSEPCTENLLASTEGVDILNMEDYI